MHDLRHERPVTVPEHRGLYSVGAFIATRQTGQIRVLLFLSKAEQTG